MCLRASPPGPGPVKPAPLFLRPLCSCRGICWGDAHPLWGCLLCPLVLLWHALSIYLFPCFSMYAVRALRVASRFFCLPCRAGCCGGFYFVDPDFTGSAAALGATEGVAARDVQWVRASALVPGGGTKRMVLFDAKIHPRDVKQGALGDCWLASSMASLAETPAAIVRVFLDAEATERGRYRVRLFDARARAWVIVTIDDAVPCTKGTLTPIMMAPNRNEMWPLLVEKAVAKFAGSYGALEGGFQEVGWQLLTGDHVLRFKKDADGSWARSNMAPSARAGASRVDFVWLATDERVPAERLFLAMQAYDRQRCVMGASRAKDKDAQGAREQARDDGIFAGHAYSILQVRRAGVTGLDHLRDSGRSGVAMVQLRNPWGHGSWKGQWARGDAAWARHPDVARALHYDAAAAAQQDDGTFWMQWEDFVATFHNVSVCDRTTKGDLRLNTHEEMPACGPAFGCVKGCAMFWCACKGVRVLYCGAHSGTDVKHGDPCCIPVAGVLEDAGLAKPHAQNAQAV